METVEWQDVGAHVGRRVRIFSCVPSTNSLALECAQDATADGLVLIAREQTAGRGQHGRVWTAPPGSSVLLSVLLFPPAHLQRPAVLTAWAAVAVCETIRETTGLEPTIKWPNDVLIAGRKVCGILIEQRGVSSGLLALVAGIGLNLNQEQAHFHEAGLHEAASLQTLTGTSFEHEDMCRQLIRSLDREYGRLLQGELEELEITWQKRLGLLHEEVLVESHEGNLAGRLTQLSFAGLTLQVAGGASRHLAPEWVRHVRRRALGARENHA